MNYFVFTQTDPRSEGYVGEVDENVTLDPGAAAAYFWPDGEPYPEPHLGRDLANPKHYKVFKSLNQLQAANYQFVDDNAPIVMHSWRQYRHQFPVPTELAEKLEQDEWDGYLDEIDEATILRRRAKPGSELPTGGGRDQIAEWVARRHLSADGSIRQILYLPHGAPEGEIRLLEVNNRISRSGDPIEPIDFGLDVGGVAVKLFVADITKDQLDKFKIDPSKLPQGWGWGGERSWGAGRD